MLPPSSCLLVLLCRGLVPESSLNALSSSSPFIQASEVFALPIDPPVSPVANCLICPPLPCRPLHHERVFTCPPSCVIDRLTMKTHVCLLSEN